MKRYPLTLFLLSVALLLLACLSLALGSADLSLSSLFAGLCGREGYETERAILLYVRLPRLLAAMLAGVGLSLSGALLQDVMGNALAGPNTVGLNAGAGLFAVLLLALAPAAAPLLPLAAFLGATLAALLVLGLAEGAGGGRHTVILAGVCCSALFQAGISLLTAIDTDLLSEYSAFSVGGFAGVRTSALILPAVLILLSLLAALLLSPRIRILSLGDSAATALGVRVRPLRAVALLLAALSAASVISFCGLLGFVGLLVPHAARRLVGPSLPRLLLTAPLLGGALLVAADLCSRLLFAPSDVPVGILTSLLGAPFFLFLLMKGRNRHA